MSLSGPQPRSISKTRKKSRAIKNTAEALISPVVRRHCSQCRSGIDALSAVGYQCNLCRAMDALLQPFRPRVPNVWRCTWC